MNAEELKSEQAKIDLVVERIAEVLKVTAITDGVISPDHYVSSLIKTAWLFKESNDRGETYDYKTAISDRIKRGEWRRRYDIPMSYLEYSLINNLVLYDADKCPVALKLLLKTAFINWKKMPGGSKVDSDFSSYAKQFSDVVKKQLTTIDSKIIIAAGTIDFFHQNGHLNNCSSHPKTYRKYYANERHIILDCYHPAARVNREYYCNDMIEALRDAKLKGFLKLDTQTPPDLRPRLSRV